MATEKEKLRDKIKRRAKALDINLIGIAPVERWKEFHLNDEEFWPQNIWPWAKNVIVLAVQIFPGMIETTPSVVYSELYNTTNRLLDDYSYRIANFLNEEGYKALFFPRDCYGDISALVKRPEAAFSHVIAGYYAGLGTIGLNHTLITPEYGPRIRLVSIITDAELPASRMMKKDVCIKCQACVRACPMQAFRWKEGEPVARMDKHKCALYHQQLKQEFHYPCGRCAAVCPVGLDKKKYGPKAISDAGVLHCRDFGAADAGEIKKNIEGGITYGNRKRIASRSL